MDPKTERELISQWRMVRESETDEKLRQIVMDNVRKGTAMANTASLTQIQSWALEAKACNEILAERKKIAEEQKKKVEAQKTKRKAWMADEQERYEAAILNLPYGTSVNGQLVAAIVEEQGGQTAREIAAWYEELEQLPDEDFQSLLDELVKERVLQVDTEGKYYLLNVVTKSLHPTDEALEIVVENSKTPLSRITKKNAKYLLKRIFRTPHTEKEMEEEIAIIKEITMSKVEMGTAFNVLKMAGIIELVPEKYGGGYCIPLLGSKPPLDNIVPVRAKEV